MNDDKQGVGEAGEHRTSTASFRSCAEPRPSTFVGRFELADGNARFAWSGSEIRMRFFGTSARVELEDQGENRFLIVIDGVPQTARFAPGRGRRFHELASGLAQGEHELSLIKLTEAFVGECTFFGCDFPDGHALAAPTPAARRIEVIGDSLSAGYGNEGENELAPFSPDTENHYLSYGALTARALGAELVTIAWSGKGVFSNRGNRFDTLTMPELWLRTLPMRADSRWEFARYSPNAVIINLGTNDLAPENPDHEPFHRSYLGFLERVRETYPDAHLFCVNGPSLRDDRPRGTAFLSFARAGVRGAVEALSARGDGRVCYVEHAPLRSSEGYGCQFHPNVSTHRRMANDLVSVMRARLNW